MQDLSRHLLTDELTDKLTDRLTKEQLNRLTAKSDWRGLWLVVVQFATTAAIFVMMSVWPSPFVWLLGLVLLGGRQLGFFVLTHEAGHRTLFRTQRYNAFVRDWLCAPMDFSNGRAYMREHLLHHQSIGTDEDPDLANYQDYPISKARWHRKLKRDLTGQTGWRNLRTKLQQFTRWQALATEDREALRRGVAWHLLVFAGLYYAGQPWLFVVWIAAQVFAYPAIVRIRQISEHAAVPELTSSDPRANTRTTLSNPVMRLLLCPHGVNYHIEHHLLASVPIYRLRAMHQQLQNSGYYADVSISAGYREVLRDATRAFPDPQLST